MNIEKYSSAFAAVIIDDISSIPNRSFQEYLTVDEWFIMMTEFLIYNLRLSLVCG